MAQAFSPIAGTGPRRMSQVAGVLNNSLAALVSSHIGDERPSYAVEGTVWVKKALTVYEFYLYDGTDDKLLFTANSSNEKITINATAGLTVAEVNDLIEAAGSGGTGTGGLTEEDATALIEEWARADNVDLIPANKLTLPNATTTLKGVVELATNAEAIAGLATNRAITARALKAVTDALAEGALTEEQLNAIIAAAGTGTGGGGSSINVVDNLTSTSAEDALSANQGKVLDTKFTLAGTNVVELISDEVGDRETADTALEALIDDKQDTLTAGTNVTIADDGTISSIAGDSFHPTFTSRTMPTAEEAAGIISTSAGGNTGQWNVSGDQTTSSNRAGVFFKAVTAGLKDFLGNEISRSPVDATTIRLAAGTLIRMLNMTDYRVYSTGGGGLTDEQSAEIAANTLKSDYVLPEDLSVIAKSSLVERGETSTTITLVNRTVLEDAGSNPLFLRTIPGTTYRAGYQQSGSLSDNNDILLAAFSVEGRSSIEVTEELTLTGGITVAGVNYNLTRRAALFSEFLDGRWAFTYDITGLPRFVANTAYIIKLKKADGDVVHWGDLKRIIVGKNIEITSLYTPAATNLNTALAEDTHLTSYPPGTGGAPFTDSGGQIINLAGVDGSGHFKLFTDNINQNAYMQFSDTLATGVRANYNHRIKTENDYVRSGYLQLNSSLSETLTFIHGLGLPPSFCYVEVSSDLEKFMLPINTSVFKTTNTESTNRGIQLLASNTNVELHLSTGGFSYGNEFGARVTNNNFRDFKFRIYAHV